MTLNCTTNSSEEEEPQALAQAGGWLAGKLLCRKGPWDPRGPQTEPGPAISSCSKGSQQHQSCSRRTLVSRMKEVILPVYPVLERYIWYTGSSTGLPIPRNMDTLETVQQREIKTIKGLEHLTYRERWSCLKGDLISVYKCLTRGVKKPESDSSLCQDEDQ